MSESISRIAARIGVAGVFALLAAFAGHQPATAQQTAMLTNGAHEDLTFSRDIAPILQQNCQGCHQEGSIGPMPLMTYEEARPFARRIMRMTQAGEMPPYQYDRDTGIQDLKYDPRMHQDDIDKIAAWVAAGAPEGDPADLPEPIEWPDPAEFQLADRYGPPDVIVRSDPYDVPAVGQDRWWKPIVPSGIPGDRCIKAIETKPSVEGRSVSHHANSTFRVDGNQAGRLSEYALGKIGEIIPEGACRRAPGNSMVEFDIHYWPNGVELEGDQVEVGIWLHDEDYEAEHQQSLTLYFLQGGRGYDIPPHGTLMTQGYQSFNTPVRIDSWQPHGHTRLVAMSIEILRANGRKEMVSMVSNWSALWHHSHIYDDDVAPLLDVGDQLILTAWYDNTDNNRYNPDPDQWVGIGDRTADEMSHAWIAVTHLDEEGIEKIRNDRQARLISQDNDGN